MTELGLSSKQENDLLDAVEAINRETCLTFGNRTQVIEFIDSVFKNPGYLKTAWQTPGFPFIGLNDIYRSLAGHDHPVFIELFSYAFTPGTYRAEKEQINSCKGFSLLNVKYVRLSAAGNAAG